MCIKAFTEKTSSGPSRNCFSFTKEKIERGKLRPLLPLGPDDPMFTFRERGGENNVSIHMAAKYAF